MRATGRVQRTIVDRAQEWIEAYAQQNPPLGTVLADGKMAAAASRTVLQWSRAWQQRVSTLRRAEPLTKFRLISHVHRAGCELIRSITTKHETFATFLSEPLDGLQRWQSACGSRVTTVCARCRRSSGRRRLILRLRQQLRSSFCILDACVLNAHTLPARLLSVCDHRHHRHQPVDGEHMDVRRTRCASPSPTLLGRRPHP